MRRHFYIILLSLMLVANLAAQTYPVRTTTIITPPYPATLEDFYANGGNKLTVQVLVSDLALSNYPVKFRVKLVGPGVEISSDPNFVPKPFMLNGGETYSLSGTDLAAYFNPDNLIFTGYSKTQYQRTGRLPDGVYRLSFEVLFYNNPKISVASTVPALIWLSQNEPPLLNFPANQEVISAITPQNIMLNWTMRQSPFSTPSFSPEYKFDLWEIWPDEKDPNDIAQSTRPIYTTTITNTSLIYTVNEPLLFIGRRYAWRVQVIDPEGNARFSNNGYSEVRWFRFGKVCPVPVLKLDTTGISHIAVKWDGDYRENKYQVRYREKNKKDAEWYTGETTNVSLDIKNLKPATTYELQVCGYCDDQLTDYSNIVSAQTKTETNFACGAAPAAPDLSQPKLLEKLNPKDYIKAGDFDVQVSSATGSNGTFSGKGVVLVPYLKYLRVAVTFKDIKVNEDHRLTNGVIYTVYDLNNSLILKTSNSSFLQVDPNKPVENNDLKKVASINIETDTTIRNVTFSNGVVTITDDNGNITHTRATSDDIVAITNKNNPNESQYVADTKTQTVYSAKPETYGSNANTASAVPQSKSGGTQYAVTFARHNLENYGFDAPSTTTPAENYESVTIDGKPQLVPWKSVEAGKFDRVKAKVTGGPVDSVHFRRESEALVMTAHGTADTAQLMLSGQGDMDEDKVFAWYPEYTKVNDSVNSVNRVLAGQLNMTSYEKKKLTVYLVPVNGSIYPENLPIVEAYLNKIYAPALVEWTVKSVTGFKVSINGTEAQKIDNSSLEDQMNYTADMKAVTDAFQTNTNYNNDSYYLFFLNDGTDQNIKGYMPFNKQFGFIFKYKQGLDPYLRTIAHELGHGPFRLYHTFSDKNKYVQSQGNTNNLMDYVDDSKTQTALQLQKYQWDEIHSWHMGANWLESGDEAEMIVENGALSSLELEEGKGEIVENVNITCNNFLTHTGRIVSFNLENQKRIKKYILNNNILSEIRDNDNNVYTYCWIVKTEKLITPINGIKTKISEKLDPLYYINAECAKNSNIKSHEVISDDGKSTRLVFDDFKDIPASCLLKAEQVQCIPDLSIVESVTPDNKLKCRKIEQTECQQLATCSDDPYNKPFKYLVQASDGTSTFGEKTVNRLNILIDKNKNIKTSANPNEYPSKDVKNATYLDCELDLFSSLPSFHSQITEEINSKLAYLQISKGYQFYIFFTADACNYTQKAIDDFANKVFANSNIDKANGIFCLISQNRYSSKDQGQSYSIGLSFGSNIKEKETIRQKVMSVRNIKNDFQNYFASAIIDAYRSIPKSRLVYHYLIFPPSQYDIDQSNQLYQSTFYSELKKPVKGYIIKSSSTKFNETGDAISAEYYLAEDNKAKKIPENPLKEQYVKDDSYNVAIIYAVKHAKWDLTEMSSTIDGPVIIDNTPDINECKYSLHVDCDKKTKDNIIFYSIVGAQVIGSLISPEVEIIILLSGATYYDATGEDEKVIELLKMYGLGVGFAALIKVAPPLIGIAGSKVYSIIKVGSYQVSRLYKMSRLAVALNQDLTEGAIKVLFEKQLSTKCVEYIIPESKGISKYLKIEQNADNSYNILSGKINEAEGNVTIEKAFTEDSKIYNLESTSESEIKSIADDVATRESGSLAKTGGVFDLSAFKNAIAKTPGIDNSSLTNLPKSFWDDGYKVTPEAGSVLKTKVDKIIANGDPTGSITEELIDDVFAGKGYKLGDGKYFGDAGNNGIDRFYYKGDISNPTEIIVFEGKQMTNGAATLNGANPATGLPIQLKEDWIRYIANKKLDGLGGLKEQTAKAIQNAPSGFIQKYVVAVDKTKGQINFLKLGDNF